MVHEVNTEFQSRGIHSREQTCLRRQVEEYLFRQRLIIVFIFAFVSGILVSSYVFISPMLAVFFMYVAGAILLAEKIWYQKIEKEVLFIFVVMLSFSLGILRYDVKDFHEYDPAFIAQVGAVAEVSGIVVSEPELRDNSTRLVIRGNEKIIVYTDLYSSVQYGDFVRISGKLQKPGIIDDGISRVFDYGKFLSKDDIYFTMSFAEVEIVSRGHGNFIKSFLFRVKGSFVNKTKDIFPEPHASLLSGLVASGKDAMPKGILEDFRRAGIVHIVVLSGYNITIIAEFLRKSFSNIFLRVRLPFGLASPSSPRIAIGASFLGVILFVLMTGAEATVMRAAIMVMIVMAAKLFGHTYSAPRTLLVAGFIMIILNPKILVFDPSFQLSFLATSALIYVVPIAERKLCFVSEKWGAKSLLATTIATQITVLPALVYSTGDVSLVSLPANMLVLFFIPITMLVGFGAALLAFVSTFIALPFTFISYLLLSWILLVSDVLGSFPLASINIPFFPLWAIVALYLLLIIFVWRWRSLSPHSAN